MKGCFYIFTFWYAEFNLFHLPLGGEGTCVYAKLIVHVHIEKDNFNFTKKQNKTKDKHVVWVWCEFVYKNNI